MQGYKSIIATTALYEVEEPTMEELQQTLSLLFTEINTNGSNVYLKAPFWKIVMRIAKMLEFVKKEDGDLKAGTKTEPRKKISKDN